MISVDQLETPTPVIDIDRVEANLSKMQSYCDAHGLSLRPHIKTHKIPEFAMRQVALGACGITCQKLGEAEVMAKGGITDILMSYPQVGVGKAQRMAALAARVRMSAAVDSEEAVKTIAEASKLSGSTIGAMIEFDSGAARTGVLSVGEALHLARLIASTEGLALDGLMTYPLSSESEKFYHAAKLAFDAEGIKIETFSGAGTRGAWQSHATHGLTEVRHGTYIFHDRTTVSAGTATVEEGALNVLATVVSQPSPGRFILDSGSKTLSSDRMPDDLGTGYGLIYEYPQATIERLYEEHALVQLPSGSKPPRVGDRVRILPNHVCVVVNLHDEIPKVRGGEVVGSFKIAARGQSR